MRAATGTAKQTPATWTNKATACKEWAMMKEALALQRDSWWRLLTPGILRPSLGRLRPSTKNDGAAVDPHQAATEQMLEGLSPELGQAVEVQGRGVKKVEQA